MGADNVTRRVLLTAGGLTLLGIYAADPARHTAATPTPDARPSPGARPSPAAQGDALSRSARDRPARDLSAHRARASGAHTPPAEQPQLAAARHGPRGSRGPRGSDPVPVTSIHDGPKAIALTIDDGPSPVYTPQVLRLLARYRITATFSMIGIEAQAYPAVAREVADAGHLIVNHTWTHLDLQWLPPALVTEQMTRAADAIHAATGRVPGLFRAPYGAWSPFVHGPSAPDPA